MDGSITGDPIFAEIVNNSVGGMPVASKPADALSVRIGAAGSPFDGTSGTETSKPEDRGNKPVDLQYRLREKAREPGWQLDGLRMEYPARRL
jgi:hypothetical protein